MMPPSLGRVMAIVGFRGGAFFAALKTGSDLGRRSPKRYRVVMESYRGR